MKINTIGEKIYKFFCDDDIQVNSYEHFFTKDFYQTNIIQNLLTYQSYSDEQDLYYNKDSVGFVLHFDPLVGISESSIHELQSLFQEIMQEDSGFQFLLYANPKIENALYKYSEIRSTKTGILSEIAKRRCEYFKELFESKHDAPVRDYRCIVSYCVKADTDNFVKLKEVVSVREQTQKLLSNFVNIEIMRPNDFITFIDSLINFRWNVETNKRQWNEYEDLAYQIPLKETDYEIRQNYIGLQENTIALKTYSVESTPDQWMLLGMKDLIGDDFKEFARIPFPFYLHFGVYCVAQEKYKDQFFNKIKVVEHQGRSSKLLKVIPRLEEEVNEYNYVRKKIHQGEKLIWSQFSVGIFDKVSNINRSDLMIKSVFRAKQFKLQENKFIHLQTFMSAMPMRWDKDYVKDLRMMGCLKTTITSEASNMLPILGEWKGTLTKGMPLVGRKGQLFHWYAFDNKNGNYNVVVVGRSGSGKSVFMQELLVNTLGLGGRVFVLDVGRSFERTCLLLNGQFIAFAKDVSICLNPFSKIPVDDTEVQEDTFAMLKSIFALMAAPTESTTDYQNALLEKAIRSVWIKYKNKATITDVSVWLMEQEDEIAHKLCIMLTPYTKDGIYARYFEGENNIDFTNPMVVIELEELKEKRDLQGVVLQMFIMTITNQMFLGDRRTPFHICIDEAWDLLRGNQTGLFIETLARRLRKYNGSLVIGTQSVNDFYQTPGALAAFENSDWMCLLAQRKESIDCLKESKRLSLDSCMEAALKSVSTRHGEFSEVMIYNAQDGFAIGRLKLDPFAGLLYSTKAEEYNLVQDYVKQGYSLIDALNCILDHKKVAA